MSWVTNRQPTAEDADSCGKVLVWNEDSKICSFKNYKDVGNLPWQPAPKPYGPPKPKRFKAWVDEVTDCDDETHSWTSSKTLIEVLPGDPPDLDALLEAVDDMAKRVEVFIRNGSTPHLKDCLKRLRKARGEKEVGDES